MKVLITLMLTLATFGVCAQKTTETINEKKIGWVTLKHMKVTDPSGSQEYIYLYYQNLKYKQLTDIGGFILSSAVELNQFTTDIKGCAEFISKGETGSYSIESGKCRLDVYDFAKGVVYITDNEGAYTSIEGTEIQLLIDWLYSVSLTASL